MEYPFKDLLPLDEVLEREGYYKDWTHLDPEVFYSLTQISEYIKTKGFGVDVRLLIAQLAEHFGLRVTQITDAMNEFSDLKPKAELSISRSVQALTKSQNALDVANGIDAKATNALSLSNSADTLSKSVQDQFNQVVIDGDSSVEAAQARVDASGQTNATLKARLDKEHNKVTAQLAQTDGKLNMQGWELNSKGREPQGIAVFISDDGRLAEYTVAKPLFESEGVPQTIAMVSSRVGGDNSLTKEQLLELQNDYGWEIASHSKTHPQPFSGIPNAQVEEELKGSRDDLRSLGLNVNNYCYVGGNYGQREYDLVKKHYRGARNSDRSYHNGVNHSPFNSHEIKTIWVDPSTYPLKTFTEQSGKTEGINRTITYVKERIDEARDSRGLLTISTHWGNFDVDTDFVNMYREIIQYAKENLEVTTLNDALDKMGNIVEVGQYTQEPIRVDNKQHFAVGADGSISGSLGVTETDKYTSQTPITHFPFGYTVTPISYSNRDGFPGELSGILITNRQISKQNVYNYQKFITTIGFNEYIRSVEGENSFGSWVSNDGFLEHSSYSLNTPPNKIPKGTSVLMVTTDSEHINLSPNGNRGVATYFRGYATETGSVYSFSNYYESLTGDIYYRWGLADNTWSDWIGLNSVKFKQVGLRTPLEDFPFGITYTTISADHDDVGIAPEGGKRGTLITHRIKGSGASYSFQEYIVNENTVSYKRFALSSSVWRTWVKVGS